MKSLDDPLDMALTNVCLDIERLTHSNYQEASFKSRKLLNFKTSAAHSKERPSENLNPNLPSDNYRV